MHCDDLHLTLLFVGDVPEEMADAIVDAGAIAAPSITLTLDRIGLWRRSGILWHGPREPASSRLEQTESLSLPAPRRYRIRRRYPLAANITGTAAP